EYLEKKLSEMTGKESRSLVLGHLQRGGTPSTSDRLISLRFGAAAIRSIADKDFNKMIVMQQNEIRRIPLSDVADKIKLVPLDGDTILTAREI
ncbi:6-phosphofructokinase, partial [Klebsiella variicola]|uniref:6-phosphofructokinase n=1 Tax=Klebsiella variicola TaxID=244366 RepID=UPI002731984F